MGTGSLILFLALPLTCCVTLGKLLCLYASVFLSCKMGTMIKPSVNYVDRYQWEMKYRSQVLLLPVKS